MITSVPGVVQTVPEVSPTSYRISRFSPVIVDTKILKSFQTPSIKPYKGTTDLEEHFTQYMERIEIIPILTHLKETCICKSFGSTLTGSTLKWLLSVPPYSITSFTHLVNIFSNQFSYSRTFEKIISDLYRGVQDPNESFWTFVNTFGREALSTPNIHMVAVVEAFKWA